MSKQFMEFDVSDFSNTNKAQLSLAEIRRDSYTEGFIKGKEEGRADAIDEYNKKLNTSMDTLEEKLKDKEICNLEDVTLSIRCGMNLLAEQLKSQN